jgi:CDP-diacylglycerol---glycerol-3-phosphate 3-phosphatidyltransferase
MDEIMSGDAKQKNHTLATVFNLPNQLTSLRLLASIVLFCFMECDFYLTSFVLFIVGAGTDWVDGYFARKYGQVTTLGRILDPFADKVIVCGTYIFLAANPIMTATSFGLRAWMVVVIVGRELLVTALRSFIEERGGDFSAKWSGKIKMVLQCFAAGTCIFYCYLAYDNPLKSGPQWCWLLLVISVWATVLSTVYSGLVYVCAAVKMLQGKLGE